MMDDPDKIDVGKIPIEWLYDFEECGAVALRMGRQGTRLVAEWPTVVRLTCTPAGTDVEVTAIDGAPHHSVQKLQGAIKALVGDLRGGLGIHASAVALERRAVLIVGDSGAGKSTAAATLCARHGGRLLADDAAVLDVGEGAVYVAPSEDRHYLSVESSRAVGIRAPKRESTGGKYAIRSKRIGSNPCRLTLVVALSFDDLLDCVECGPLSGADAALRVLGSLYRFGIADRRDELDRVMRVYDQVPFLAIRRPRSQPDVTERIVRAIGELP